MPTPDQLLFAPRFLGCPVCNKAKNSHSGTAIGAHTKLPGDRFIGWGCKHEFSFYDALKYDCSGGTFGVLGVFSHWNKSTTQKVQSGKLATIALTTPDGLTPFAAFLTQYASTEHPHLGVFPSVISLTPTEILISVPATINVSQASLGAEIELNIGVYAYRSEQARGWKRLLYESLKDYAEHRYSLAVFKVATSIELYADWVFEKYLTQVGMSEPLRKRLLRSARDWQGRAARISDLVPTILTSAEVKTFTDALSPFRKYVREPRNAFAHEHAASVDYKAADAAYQASFDVTWVLNRLDLAL